MHMIFEFNEQPLSSQHKVWAITFVQYCLCNELKVSHFQKINEQILKFQRDDDNANSRDLTARH